MSPLVFVAVTTILKPAGAPRYGTMPVEGLGRGVELQPRGQRRPVRKIGAVGQGLAVASVKVFDARAKFTASPSCQVCVGVCALTTRPCAARLTVNFRLSQQQEPLTRRTAMVSVPAEFPVCKLKLRQVGGVDSERIGGRVGEHVGTVLLSRKLSLAAPPGSGVVERAFSDRLAGQRIAGDEQRREL